MIGINEIRNFLSSCNLPPIEIDQRKVNHINTYLNLLQKWNKRLNLVSRREIENLELHILDSFVIAPFLQCKNVTDLGSGGGLPAIPLAIIFPEKQFTLVEARSKKAAFLRIVTIELGLSHVKILNQRVEELSGEEYKADCITSRAFAPLNELLDLSFPLLEKNGKIYTLAGGDIPLPGDERFRIIETFFYNLPGKRKKRQLLILEKNG